MIRRLLFFFLSLFWPVDDVYPAISNQSSDLSYVDRASDRFVPNKSLKMRWFSGFLFNFRRKFFKTYWCTKVHHVVWWENWHSFHYYYYTLRLNQMRKMRDKVLRIQIASVHLETWPDSWWNELVSGSWMRLVISHEISRDHDWSEVNFGKLFFLFLLWSILTRQCEERNRCGSTIKTVQEEEWTSGEQEEKDEEGVAINQFAQDNFGELGAQKNVEWCWLWYLRTLSWEKSFFKWNLIIFVMIRTSIHSSISRKLAPTLVKLGTSWQTLQRNGFFCRMHSFKNGKFERKILTITP